MQKIVSFEIAKFLNNLGYNEPTDVLYQITKPGIRAVISQLDGKKCDEKIFYEGSLEKVDEQFGVIYPSAHWIPAPFIFDAVKFIDEKFNIRIIPWYDDGYFYSFTVPSEFKPEDLLQKKFDPALKLDYTPVKSFNIELCYENALKDFLNLVETNQIKL